MDTQYSLLDANTGEYVVYGLSAMTSNSLNVAVGTIFLIEDENRTRAYRIKEVVVPLRKPSAQRSFRQLHPTRIYVEPCEIPSFNKARTDW
jgi:hypothetical protein